MKIEIIEKESKPVEVPFVVGGIYEDKHDGAHEILIETYHGTFSLWSMTRNVFEYVGKSEDDMLDILSDHYVYVPNARLVIER